MFVKLLSNSGIVSNARPTELPNGVELTEVTYPDPETDAYTYDDNGNRLSLDSTDYTYDAADQMLTAEAVSFDYDANGNQTERDSDTFAYDHENRLIEAVTGAVTSTSDYNGDGLRMSLTVDDGSPVTTDYAWDINRSLPVVLDDGTNQFVYGLDLISATDGSSDQVYYVYDGLGSVTALTDDSGAATDTYSYDVFGALRASSGSTPNGWLFTGEQQDADSGLYYLRARYYDPASGRFLGRDPLGIGNRYSYVSNNPINFVDPYGLIGLPKISVPNPIDVAGDIVVAAYQTGDDILPYVSGVVQAADLLPIWGTIPVVNIPATLISWPLDVGAFGFSMYDIWTSDCGFKKKIGMSFNSGVNLGVGVAGQGLAALASETAVGPAVISLGTSAIETSLYAANELAMAKCSQSHYSVGLHPQTAAPPSDGSNHAKE